MSPLIRRTLPEALEHCAAKLDEARLMNPTDMEITISGVALSLRMLADLERKGL